MPSPVSLPLGEVFTCEVEDVEAAGHVACVDVALALLGRPGLCAGHGAPASGVAPGGLAGLADAVAVARVAYEPNGACGRCALRFAPPVQRAERVNLLEEPEGPVDVGAVTCASRCGPSRS